MQFLKICNLNLGNFYDINIRKITSSYGWWIFLRMNCQFYLSMDSRLWCQLYWQSRSIGRLKFFYHVEIKKRINNKKRQKNPNKTTGKLTSKSLENESYDNSWKSKKLIKVNKKWHGYWRKIKDRKRERKWKRKKK